MPKKLTAAQVAQYRRDGYVAPVTIMSPEEAGRFRAALEAFEQAQGRPLHGPQKTKCCLLFPWMYRLATWPALLDAVEDLIGPNILVFQNGAWLKEANDHSFVSRHQDSTYFGLEPPELVTAWVALTPSTPANGCVRVLPGTHRLGQLPVDYTEVKPTNLLTSGQRVRHAADESAAVDLELQPGQMSLHHVHLIHCSGANDSPQRRVGFSVACMPPEVRQSGDCRSTALLVRGEDRCGHFALEEPPGLAADPATMARHDRAVALYRANVREKGNQTITRLD
jgi:hypothetical protein